MVVESDWAHVRVDGTFHRSYRIAGWPQLPVGADWLSDLLADPARRADRHRGDGTGPDGAAPPGPPTGR